MATADESSNDLSVRLNWPIDPLATDPVDNPSADPDVDAETMLAALESPVEDLPEDDALAVEAVAARLDHVTAELVKVMRSLNTSIRRVSDQNVKALNERVAELRDDVAKLVATTEKQRNAYGAELAAELKAWRRRLPTKGTTGAAISEKSIDELVNRLADEFEIRLFAAVKKSGAVKKR